MLVELGRLCQEVKVQEVKDGKRVLNNAIAIRQGKDKTTFLDIVAWDGVADLIGSYFNKGDEIFIEGHLENMQRKKETIEFQAIRAVVQNIRFVNGKKKKGEGDNEKKENEGSEELSSDFSAE